MSYTPSADGPTLRGLPFAARITLALFLVSVGVGYVSAIVNLHFQEASPGELLPTSDDVVHAYHGKKKVSQLERLLVAHPSLPFNGQGSMRSAFTRQRVGGWAKMRKDRAKDLNVKKADIDVLEEKDPTLSRQIDQHVTANLDGERRALVAWVRGGADKVAYDDDAFPLPLKGPLAVMPITPRMVQDEKGPHGERLVKVKSILEARCARCHCADVGGAGSQYPLTDYQDLKLYTLPEKPTGKSLSKLALTTHVHLLAFSVLYGLTGLLFALTSYWRGVRLLIAPLPLLAQMVDISFWWLARLDEPYGPMFANAIRISGGVVALGLGLQIILTLFNLFGRVGKVVLVFLILAAGVGAFNMKDRLAQYLETEKATRGSQVAAPE
jgi:hypothetical protein